MLAQLLGREGYAVELAADGQAMLHLGLTRRYDVLVVDRALPAIYGPDVLARLRSRGVATPALMLTARAALADRVAGLDAVARLRPAHHDATARQRRQSGRQPEHTAY